MPTVNNFHIHVAAWLSVVGHSRIAASVVTVSVSSMSIFIVFLAAPHAVELTTSSLSSFGTLGGVHKQVSIMLNVKMMLGRGVLTRDAMKSADPAYVPREEERPLS